MLHATEKKATMYYFTYIYYIQLKRSDLNVMKVVILETNLT